MNQIPNRFIFKQCRHEGLFSMRRFSERMSQVANSGQRLFVVANFSDHPQEMDADRLRVYGPGYSFTDLVSSQTLTAEQPLRLEAYQCVWLEARSAV
jgi:hypothetical protein